MGEEEGVGGKEGMGASLFRKIFYGGGVRGGGGGGGGGIGGRG